MLMPAMQWLFPPHCIAADMDEISISFWIQSGPDWHPGFYQNEGPQMTLAFGMDFHINLPGREPGTPQLSVRPDNFQNLWTFVEWTRNQHWHCKLSYGSWLLSRLESFSIEPMFGIRKVPQSLRITSCRWVSGWTSPSWIRYASRTGIVWWSLCCWGISVDLWPPPV